ncbi:MAG: flagellar FliJ family protein [Pirellulales bacterium]|nr:flagellar FliJ family protein [Pirellulales bacterium]
MPKFKFRLATLLRLKESVREERHGELARAYEADALLERQQEELVCQREGLMEECRRAVRPGIVDVDRLIESQRFELLLKAQQQYVAQQREAVAVEIDRRRQALVEANREVRVLEKLRERLLARHRQDEDQRQVKLMDELAMQRVGREAIA